MQTRWYEAHSTVSKPCLGLRFRHSGRTIGDRVEDQLIPVYSIFPELRKLKSESRAIAFQLGWDRLWGMGSLRDRTRLPHGLHGVHASGFPVHRS